MAIVVGPLHSSEARGAVGGLVYNSHRGRAYVKANTAPTTQYSATQVNTRALMSPVIALWQTISDHQRLDWGHFASMHPVPSWTGSDTRLSGWNWFAKVNFRLNQMAITLRENPPDQITAILFDYVLMDVGGYYANINWTPLATPPDPPWRIAIWITNAHSTGAHPSIKLAHLAYYFLEQSGDEYLDLQYPGTYSVYAIPVSEQGITMPPTKHRITVA